MFDIKTLSVQTTSLTSENSSRNHALHLYNKAQCRFKAVLFRGSISRLKRRLLDRPQQLYDLHVLKQHLHLRGSFYSGIQVVPIRSIIGSEGRASDFDMDFHPVSDSARERWINVALAYLSNQPLAPVQLIRVGDAYFVRDGHHRISVGRAFGQIAIDAEVITWRTSAPLPWQARALQKSPVIPKAIS
jgi:hypothetical protein